MDEKDIRAQVDARVKAEEETLEKQTDDGVTPKFVRECFAANRLGDGTLFAVLNKGRFVANVSAKDEWLRWGGHYWEIDKLKARYASGVEAVVAKYLEEVDRLNESIEKALAEKNDGLAARLTKKRDAYLGRVRSLRDDGADKCLNWATRAENGLTIKGEDLDRDPWLLACPNGVIELRTGRFRAGRPDDLLTRAAAAHWADIDHPAPLWEQFLRDTFSADEELIAYLGRAFGYGITGLTTENIFLVLLGEGRNGKSTLVETLKFVLGGLSSPIQSEMLLDQRSARASSGPSPDVMSLKGPRLVFASETDKNRRFSPSKVKWLSGGDTLVGRNPHDKYETEFEPTHLLCLLTNNLPHAPGEDYAFWQRLHLVPFNFRFVDEPKAENERPRVKDLPEKLRAEAPGILAWLIRGCLAWQRQGLNPPQIVRSATEQARISEDLIAGFVDACAYPPEDCSDVRTQYGQAYAAFAQWYEGNIGDAKYCPRKKDWSELMERRFEKRKVGQFVWFYGLSLLPEATPEGY